MSYPAALSQEELGQKLLAALNALYAASSSSAVRKGANDWLSSFRFTEEAWMISHTLLGSPESVAPEALFFAAQTLHIKLRHDFDQLPSHLLPDLKNSIIAHVYRFSSGPRNVLTKLCLALAAFAVRTHSLDLWGPQRDVVATLVATFTKSGSPDHLICLLELLHVLLAEADDERLGVDGDTRIAFMHTVRASSPNVLKFLTMALSQSGNNAEVHKGIFRCMASWVYWGDISANGLMSSASTLVSATFSALAAPHLFDVAVDAALEMIRTYNDYRVHGSVCEVLVPGVMSQAARLAEAISKRDDATVTGLARLVVELGFSYMDLIIGEADMNQAEVVATVLKCSLYEDMEVAGLTLPFWGSLSASLRQAAHDQNPQQQSVVARRTEQFRPMIQNLAETCIRRCVLTEDLFESGTDTVMKSISAGQRSGAAGSVQSVTREARSASDERKEYRVGFAYCLKEDCVDLLGFEPCMNAAVAAVHSAWTMILKARDAMSSDNAWRLMEGALFATSALLGAPGVHLEDHASLQSLRDLVAMLPRLCADTSIYVSGYNANQNRARCVQLLVMRTCIGFFFDETSPRRVDLCLWLKANQETSVNLLAPLLKVIFSALLPSELPYMLAADIPAIAAPALRSICSECPHVVPERDLFQFYIAFLPNEQGSVGVAGVASAVARIRSLPKEFLKTLIEAISSVINVKPDYQSRINYFGQLLTPLAMTLRGILLQTKSETGSGAKIKGDNRNAVVSILDCMKMVIRHVDISGKRNGNLLPNQTEHPIITALRQLWPMFDEVIALASADVVVIEKLFSVNKYVIRQLGLDQAQAVLSPILGHAMQVYSSHASSPAIYMLRVCISDLTERSQDVAVKLAQTFKHFVELTCGKYLTTLKHLRDHPDIVDDFFLLCNRVLKSKVPVVSMCFNSPDILSKCVHLGSMGLLQDHPDALTSVLTFFERLFFSTKDIGPNAGEGNRQARHSAIINCMMQVGGLFMENLILGIAGETPRRHVSHGDITLSHVMFELGAFDMRVLTELLKYGLGKLDQSYASNIEKEQFYNKMVGAFEARPNNTSNLIYRDVEKAVAKFSKLSRGNRETQRRKDIARRKSVAAKKR